MDEAPFGVGRAGHGALEFGQQSENPNCQEHDHVGSVDHG